MKKEKQNISETEAAAVPTVEITAEQIADLQDQYAKAIDNWKRTAADFENFKKRAAREKTEAAQFASAALLQKLLPVLDNFEMAQAAAQNVQGDKLASLQAGIAMIQQQLKSAFAETGLEEIDVAIGKPFDPMWHEAVSQVETTDTPEGQVVQQLRKGYRLRERLLRPASVVVAKRPAKESSTGSN
ncbi:MAG TPA: nucleotide exchange factor GrpE [Verrucomicrobiae bacterium]